MIIDDRAYSVLLVSSSDKITSFMHPILQQNYGNPVVTMGNVSSAKRALLEGTFDIVIINSPVLDDIGVRFAIDAATKTNASVLIMVKPEIYDETHFKVLDYGVFVLSKPISQAAIVQALRWLSAGRERLRLFEKKSLSLEDKMAEIRLINRAKWALMENLQMTEPEAHRYIEKQSMDRGMTKKSMAEEIIKTYNI